MVRARDRIVVSPWRNFTHGRTQGSLNWKRKRRKTCVDRALMKRPRENNARVKPDRIHREKNTDSTVALQHSAMDAHVQLCVTRGDQRPRVWIGGNAVAARRTDSVSSREVTYMRVRTRVCAVCALACAPPRALITSDVLIRLPSRPSEFARYWRPAPQQCLSIAVREQIVALSLSLVHADMFFVSYPCFTPFFLATMDSLCREHNSRESPSFLTDKFLTFDLVSGDLKWPRDSLPRTSFVFSKHF